MAEIINTSINVDINTSGAAAELRRLQQQINAFNLTLNKNQKVQGQAAKVWSENLASAVNRTGIFRAEVVKMQNSAAALDSVLRKGQATLGQFFSAAFNKRSAMAAETFALAAERARTMQTQFIATGKSVRGMQDALAIRPLTAFSSQLSIAAQRTEILGSMFRQGTTQLINFGKNVQWAGRQLMVGFTVPLTIFGGIASKVFKELETQTVNFKKVYGDIFTTPMELQENLKAVESLAREFTKYGIAAKDTMSLASDAAAAGRQNAELTDAVRESTRLATLGQMDQNSALETTIALQSAFRLSGQQLTDTINFLNMVENQTVVSLQDIASAIPRVAPVIQGLGGDVKDLTVFLAAMQEGGVSAEQGSNALKSGLASLINPSKEATKELGKLGINIKAIVEQNQGDLMGTVTMFSRALSTLTEFQQQQVLETVFGKFQYARLGALFENIIRDGSQAQQVIASMGYTTEQLAQTADKELKTVEEAFSVQLTGAIERLKLSIAPIGQLFTKMAIPIVNFLIKIVDWFNRLPEGTKNFTAIAAVITGLLIPAATMMFGLFANLIGTLAKMGQSVSMFGITLLKKGPIAAIQTLTQSNKYLSLSEIDAANAARQLGSATSVANEALLRQVSSAGNASIAINNLTASYQRLIAQQITASRTQGMFFAPGGTASNIAKNQPGGRFLRRNMGGTIPGTGNTDTVPAMLTPGEFVVNKEATRNNLGLLKSINAQRFNKGGGVANKGKMFYGVPPIQTSFQDFVELLRAQNVDFSGQSKTTIDKVSYRQLNYLFDLYTNNGIETSKINKLQELVVQKAFTNKKNINQDTFGSIKSQQLKDIVKFLNERGASLGDPKTFFDGIGMTHAAHTTMPKIINFDKIGPYTFPVTGVPLQELTNRVIGLNSTTNLRLSGEGVRASELLKEVQEKKTKLYHYMSGQFAKYLELNGITKPADVKRSWDLFSKGSENSYKSLVTQLTNLGDTMIADEARGGAKPFQEIFDESMTKFSGTNNVLNNFHKELVQLKNQRLPRVEDLRLFFRENSVLQSLLKSKNIGPKEINKLSGKQLWKFLLEANGYDVNNPEVRKGFWKKILSKKGDIQQTTSTKPGVVNPLSYFSQEVKQYVGSASKGQIPFPIRFRGVALNKGNIVPGVGNTDTVPAMLTPGEFVVNKKATRNNLGLLHYINAQKLNKGGKVKNGILYAEQGVGPVKPFSISTNYPELNMGKVGPTSQIGGAQSRSLVRGAGATGGVAGLTASILVPMITNSVLGPIGSMASSIIAYTVAQKAATTVFNRVTGNNKILAEQAKMAGDATKQLGIRGLMATKVLGVAAGGWLAIGASAGLLLYSMKKTADDIKNSGKRFVESLYGSSNKMESFAASFGRENVQQQLATKRAEAAGGAAITQEAKQFSTQFLQSEAGKSMLLDIENVSRTRGSQGRNDAILNQLLRGVVTKSITPEEAKAIALDIGTQLNDKNIGIRISGQISQLTGPNGEELAENILKINSLIVPKLDLASTEKIVSEQWSKTNIFEKISANLFGGGVDSLFTKTLAAQSMQALEITKEQIDLLKLELESGNITYQQFIDQKTKITIDAMSTTEDAMSAIAKKFVDDAEGMKKAIKDFRAEVEIQFEITIKDLSKEDKEKIQNFVSRVGREGAAPTERTFYGAPQTIAAPETEKGLEASTALQALDNPDLMLALETLENSDAISEKLSNLYSLDPSIFNTIEEYFTLGGNLGDLLGKSEEEILNYSEALDKLSAVPSKFKEGIDISRLIGDPEKLQNFIKESNRAQRTLDELAKQENITKEVALNIVTQYMGEKSTAKKLLDYYLLQGVDFKNIDLNAIITMSVANPEVASALSLIERSKSGNVSLPALEKAYAILSSAGATAGIGGPSLPPTGGGEGEDVLKGVKDRINETNQLIVASQKLISLGLKPEIAATLNAAEAKAILSKNTKQLIKDLNQESIKSRVLAQITQEPQKGKINVLNAEIKLRDQAIAAINRQISAVQRQNELDQRQINIRQKALDELGKKEKAVNEVYDKRTKALDLVSKVNERMAQQQQDRIALASALTSGDFGAAASAAAGMTANYAQGQIEDTRAALETQRQEELAGLQVSINGTLMNREQIEASIDSIQERMYQRDLSILPLQDQIYNKELEKQNLQIQIDDINNKIAQKIALQDANMAKQLKTSKNLRENLWSIFQISKATAERNWGFKLPAGNTGGEFVKKAFGGMINAGSKEPPPILKMAYGNLVPGMGMTDKVPALLTPGEFVVRKSAAQANLPLLNAINGNVFPKNIGMSLPSVEPANNPVTVSNMASPVYNYNVSVNVPNTTSSPNEIADVVINKIKMAERRQIRGNRF